MLTTPVLFFAGCLAVSIPVAIHLLSRGKPKTIAFPALRFVKIRAAANKRRLKLKRFALLAARVALCVLLGLTLARPVFVPAKSARTAATAREAANAQSSQDARAAQAGNDAQNSANAQDSQDARAAQGESVGIVGRNEPVAAAVVVDSSVRTGRVVANRTLFEREIETAAEIVAQLPPGSEIAVLDGTTDGDAFQPDAFAAKERLAKLEIEPAGRPVARTVVEALRLVDRSALPAREIFVLTDGTRPGWSEADAAKLRREYAASKSINGSGNDAPNGSGKPDADGSNGSTDAANDAPRIFYVDFGDDAFQNVSIADLALSAETLAVGAPLRIDVDVESVGPNERTATVELVLFDPKKLPANASDPKIFNDDAVVLRRESQNVSFPSGRAKRTAVFQTSGLPLGANVGCVRIVGGDSLAADDVRPFAVDVVSERRSLVVAPRPVAEKSLFLTEALAPEEYRKTGRAPFELDVVPFAPVKTGKAGQVEQTGRTGRTGRTGQTAADRAPLDLQSATDADLARYRAIFLLDPPALDAPTVRKLTTFVENGGGLGVFLGRSAAPISAFQTPEVVELLGAKPTAQVRAPNWNRSIRPANYDSPILAIFRPYVAGGIPWDALPVGRFWRLTELAPTATVVANFGEIGETNATSEISEIGETSANKESGATGETARSRETAQTGSATSKAPAVRAARRDDFPALIENRLGLGTVATLATPISDSPQDSGAWNALTTGDAVWVFVALADGLARRLSSGDASILNYSLGETATLRSPLKSFPALATLTTPTGEEIATPTDVERRQIRFPGTKTPGIYRLRTTPNADGESLDKAFVSTIAAEQFDLTRPTDAERARLWEGIPYKSLDLNAAATELEAARRGKESEPYSFLVLLLGTLFVAETYLANRFYKR